MIGPQFSISHYRKYLNGDYVKKSGQRFWSETRVLGIKKGLAGLIGLGLSAVLGGTYGPNHLYPEGKFWALDGFLSKFFYFYMYGVVVFYKYISTWLFSEGALILSGMGTIEETTGRGDSAKKVLHHNGMANVNAIDLALGNNMGAFVKHFNINTNKWVLKYVYKRLAFFGNKEISHISTLMFLALWHGSHIGYFTCFFYEFVIIHCEKRLMDAGVLIDGYANLFRGIGQKLLYWWILTGYCNIDFTLLKSHLFIPVYQEVYFYGHVYVIIMFLYSAFALKRKRKAE